MTDKIKDIDLDKVSTVDDLLQQYRDVGFQASHLAEAVDLIEKMKKENTTVFLSFTANMLASGLRGVIAELCRKKFVDVIITTAGSLDHDVIKSFEPYLKGSFYLDDNELRQKNINRLGNILIPNETFSVFEEKFQPMLADLYKKNKVTTPSDLADFIGSKLEDKNSFLKACHENNIPVFCPGITDGAVGLQVYFFKQKKKDFLLDVSSDLTKLLQIVLDADKTSAIVLGGGIAKHHTIGSNLLREGLDYAVYLTTAHYHDGSLSGANTSEAKSWGKIKEAAKEVTVYGDVTILFPVIMRSIKERGLL